jgi:hypothetical protein
MEFIVVYNALAPKSTYSLAHQSPRATENQHTIDDTPDSQES